MSMVRLALRRPYTAAVGAMLIVLMGVMSVTRMIVDIFPVIDIPVVMVVWNYPGLPSEDMERRVVLITERAYSQTVNGIDRIESQSLPSTGLLKVYFQAGTDIGSAIAQITAVNDTVLRQTPPGMTPPLVIQYNASNVPVVQLTLSSKSLTEQAMFDYAVNFLRLKLFTIPGLSTPAPFGGRNRQITVDLDPSRLQAVGLSSADVVNTLTTSNLILPAGTARLGEREYNVALNSSPTAVEQFNHLPIGIRNGVPITLGDVSTIRDAYSVQNNIVHVEGNRSVYMTILKHADASTLAVVDATRALMPEIQAGAPDGLDLKLDFDQSVFVRAAVNNVIKEAIIASILVSLMILLFLGSWRNTVIVLISIPLSIAAAIGGIFMAGQTINLMTLGGLALAIGLLVDNATVTIENIHRNLALGKTPTLAILDGSAEVIQPLTVATLAICITFFPVVLLEGASRFLFIPMAITVVLAMLASYILSFTIVPAFARQILIGHGEGTGNRFTRAFENAFDRFREGYGRALEGALAHRWFMLGCVGALLLLTSALATRLGMDFFPAADVGIVKLHVRAPSGTRLETTEKIVAAVEDEIRRIIPPSELRLINDNVGIPPSINLAFVPSDNVGAMDAEILISLNSPHRPSAEYMRTMRKQLAAAFPGIQFFFQNADIVSQVLNFGASSPIDIQVLDNNFGRGYQTAQKILQEVQKIPGVADAHIAQVLDYPTLQVNVDRLRAAKVGVTQRDVASNLLTSLAGSSLTSPSYFLNPQNGVTYSVAVRMPVDAMAAVPDLMGVPIGKPLTDIAGTNAPNTPLSSVPRAPGFRLGDVAAVNMRASAAMLSHQTVQRVINVMANVDGRDLGGTVGDIKKVIAEVSKGMPITTHIEVRGQYQVMQSSFVRLAGGIVLSVVLVYALLVILFQSWVDPFIIMLALPGALIGIIWMLIVTNTTINVESLMGTIMSVGISVSNSILVVSFANQLRSRTGEMSALEGVIEAAKTRLRPILMTALAMIIGMVPMALGLGEAGEQNAPLGRAVIGGLMIATFATLFLVPIGYTLLRRKPPTLYTLDKAFAAEAAGESTSHA
ncbi:MAG TPA: efflux RND transporter permease subunit [Alphaproteobacteria bacterium]|jgi:multidrug efflux pump subunit AcrB|nr:efflux RND transporter permease subunit [Alphaproteobacteria bacterium]